MAYLSDTSATLPREKKEFVVSNLKEFNYNLTNKNIKIIKNLWKKIRINL